METVIAPFAVDLYALQTPLPLGSFWDRGIHIIKMTSNRQIFLLSLAINLATIAYYTILVLLVCGDSQLCVELMRNDVINLIAYQFDVYASYRCGICYILRISRDMVLSGAYLTQPISIGNWNVWHSSDSISDQSNINNCMPIIWL